jgi:hypothetical protein
MLPVTGGRRTADGDVVSSIRSDFLFWPAPSTQHPASLSFTVRRPLSASHSLDEVVSSIRSDVLFWPTPSTQHPASLSFTVRRPLSASHSLLH